MAAHNDFGKEGERETVDFLTKEGRTILERNFRYGYAGVDIISQKGNILHTVEVGTRSSTAYGEPESFADQRKIDLLVKSANYYVRRKDLDVEVQFDIISIIKSNVEYNINYIEDAFHPF